MRHSKASDGFKRLWKPIRKGGPVPDTAISVSDRCLVTECYRTNSVLLEKQKAQVFVASQSGTTAQSLVVIVLAHGKRRGCP